MQLSLLNRLHLIRTWVVSAFHPCDSLPFEIRLKPMYDIHQTVFVWREVVGKLHHQLRWFGVHTRARSLHFRHVLKAAKVEAAGVQFRGL